MSKQIGVMNRIWLLVVSIPIAYCVLVAASLPFRSQLNELPQYVFPVVLVLGVILIDWLLVKFIGPSAMTWKKRFLLLGVFFLALGAAFVLGSLGPAA